MPSFPGRLIEVQVGTSPTSLGSVVPQVDSFEYDDITDVQMQPKGLGSGTEVPVTMLSHVEGTITRRFDKTLVSPGGTPTDDFYKWARTRTDRTIQVTIKDETGTPVQTLTFDKVRTGRIRRTMAINAQTVETVPFFAETVTVT